MFKEYQILVENIGEAIYSIKSGQVNKRVVGKNLPQMLTDFGSRWQSVNEADCNQFRSIQTQFGA